MQEEKLFTIPLRREFLKVPKYKRTQKSMKAIKLYLQKHMKSDQIKIGEHLNNEIWKRGRKNPPSRIKIKAIKDDKNIIRAELPEFDIKLPEEKGKKKKKEKEVKAEETKAEEEAKKKEVELEKEEKIFEKETRMKEIKEDTTKEMTKEEETLMKERGIIKESQKPHHLKGK